MSKANSNIQQKIKKQPIRKCVGCNESRLKKELCRVVRTPDGNIELDDKGKKSGRGAYLCFSEECLEKAIKNHGLERSLKAAIPKEIYEDLKKEFDRIGKQQ